MGKIRFLSQGKISDIPIRCARVCYTSEINSAYSLLYRKTVANRTHGRRTWITDLTIMFEAKIEALPGVLENRGKNVFISGEQGNKGQIFRGTGEQRQYWGTGNIRKETFDFGRIGEQANLFQGNKGTGIPLEQVSPWEGLEIESWLIKSRFGGGNLQPLDNMYRVLIFC